MPLNSSDYERFEKIFNEKYGVKFSYKEFDDDIKRNQNFSENFLTSGEDVHGEIYKKTFSKLYKQALTNYADRRINAFKSGEFLQDYIKMVNAYDLPQGKRWPKPAELVEKAQRDLNDPKKGIPDTKEEYIIKRYESRELPIRKMRAHAQALANSGDKDPAKFSTILAYANALEEINSRRPRWWRVLNYFRNKAEQREAKNFKAIVRKALGLYKEGVVSTSSRGVLTEAYSTARDISRDNTLLDAKEDLKTIRQDLKLESGTKTTATVAQNQKEKMTINEVSPKAEQVKTESLGKSSKAPAHDELKKEEIQNSKH